MAVPLYVFYEFTRRAAYLQLVKENKHNDWWKRLMQLREEYKLTSENVIMCDSADDQIRFLVVTKYPDFDEYLRERRIMRSQVHLEHYFDVRTQFGCKRDDVNEAFGEMPASRDFP